MEYFVEQASTHHEAERKVRAKYGERARIMHHKSIRMGGFLGMFSREGVEVTGYFANEPVRRDPPQRPQGFEEEKKKILGSVKSEKSFDLLLEEMKSLKEQIGTLQIQPQEKQPDHPTIEAVRELLERNEFTWQYVDATLRRIRSEFSMEELEDLEAVKYRVVDWIAESVSLHRPTRRLRPEVFILVGPTGVGKTTTIAKLAAIHGLAENGDRKDVRIITIDNYRIGAKEQIETYGSIMDVPVSCVESFQEMKKQIALYNGVDLVFVDTIGKSPREFSKLGEMNELLRGIGANGHFHLAVSATTKTSDMDEILRQFEPFGYESVVITKVDETNRLGNVISLLAERRKPVSYITDGQRVPQDISPATVERLLMSLEGFQVDRERVAQQFDSE
ncbi:MAG: flagellar biosynthesis protein FlhF [Spirochaetota bacterium]